MSIAPTIAAGSRVTPAIFPTMSAGVTRSLRPTLRKIVALPASRPVRAGRSYLDLRGRSSVSPEDAAGGVGATGSAEVVRSDSAFGLACATGLAHAGAAFGGATAVVTVFPKAGLAGAGAGFEGEVGEPEPCSM